MICEICQINKAEEVHHKFSQTKRNKKVYGDLIHEDPNLQYLCKQCHINRAKKYTEYEFRTVMQDAGFELPELKKPVGRCRREY